MIIKYNFQNIGLHKQKPFKAVITQYAKYKNKV